MFVEPSNVVFPARWYTSFNLSLLAPCIAKGLPPVNRYRKKLEIIVRKRHMRLEGKILVEGLGVHTW